MRPTVAIACVILIFPALVRGWGGTGHQIVALIAENHLTPEAKAGIKDLLGAANISDAEVASWADEVRRSDRKDTAKWHYVDIPYEAKTFDRKRDGAKGANVIDAIEQQTKILANKSKPRAERIDALKFAVHFVGDVHQPLHACERDNDAGGNAEKVQLPDGKKPVKLHAAWDTNILQSVMGKTQALDYANELDKQITDEQRKACAAGNAVTWANEAHKVAVDVAYVGIGAKNSTTTPDEKYMTDAQAAITLQLQRAGARLAMVLNTAFQH